eukprot:CAMPEP_0118930166 /NCGR_PEP_ID=MMETSP1169-20130426/6945_1 /TAXON_ID=36882 /ORGANISM="Pyramimonas obovata, Strain CCMP722" /LENGTH=146 /DNA_ID=CAMNT_0006872483 /DNA_START=111 /DNA_END=549 /DNA_ORIENTATION=-
MAAARVATDAIVVHNHPFGVHGEHRVGDAFVAHGARPLRGDVHRLPLTLDQRLPRLEVLVPPEALHHGGVTARLSVPPQHSLKEGEHLGEGGGPGQQVERRLPVYPIVALANSASACPTIARLVTSGSPARPASSALFDVGRGDPS